MQFIRCDLFQISIFSCRYDVFLGLRGPIMPDCQATVDNQIIIATDTDASGTLSGFFKTDVVLDVSQKLKFLLAQC